MKNRATGDTLHYVDRERAGAPPCDLPPAAATMLQHINQKIAAAESLDALARFLFDSLRDISACDRIGIAFVEDDARRIVSYCNVTAYEPVLLQTGFAQELATSSLAHVIERGAVRIMDDLDAYLAAHPDSPATKLIVREGVRSSLTCPLTVEGRTVGVLFRSARKPRAYSERDACLHYAIGERLAQAVEKAYRIEQLQAANHAYMEMLGFASHELKSPVASILTDVSLLTGGFLGELKPKQLEKLARITVKGRYLLGLIQDFLDLARIEAGQLRAEFQTVDDFIPTVMNSALDLVTPQIDERRMRVIRKLPTSLPPVECDPDLIRIVLVNLLSNAAKYGRPGGEITIETGILKNGLYIRVRNEGPGFAPEQRGRLFRKFSRLQSPELRKERGTGVGLYTSWNIVYLHGGRIDAESEPGAWAEFRFTIPQPPLRPDTAHSAPQAPDATAGPATVSPRARSRRQSPGAG